MSTVKVKICGITRPEDGLAAAQAGADAVGLVFYPPSPRAVSIAQAAAVVAALPPFVSVVALFVNPTAAEVTEVLAALPIDVVQFHGDEPEPFCQQFGRRYIKALRVRAEEPLAPRLTGYPSASALLLDSDHPHLYGGSGQSFNWQQLPTEGERPLILAGGLTVENVGRAVRQSCLYAVDVSSGVELAKGVKDHAKMRAFLQQVEQSYVQTL